MYNIYISIRKKQMGNLAPNVYNMWSDVKLWGHLNGILWLRTHDSACFSLFEQHVHSITSCSWAYGGMSLTRETDRTMKVEPYVSQQEKNYFLHSSIASINVCFLPMVSLSVKYYVNMLIHALSLMYYLGIQTQHRIGQG